MKLPSENEEGYPFWKSKDGTEYCSEEEALALMLKADYLFAGSSRSGPFFVDESGEGGTEVTVNCSDLFDWASADCERLPYDQIGPLYKSIVRTGGSTEWCCLRRKMRPQGPVERRMRESGRWTDALEALPEREKRGI